MKIILRPELQARLSQIASQTGLTPEHIVEGLVEKFVDHDRWFREEVQKGLTELDQDEFIAHDEVFKRIVHKLYQS